ncbi:MAG TPA: TolC family protein [Dissulfurispiraceae bacterium]|nr:TolC family protein [Dissulfurispiraceae bacterium]
MKKKLSGLSRIRRWGAVFLIGVWCIPVLAGAEEPSAPFKPGEQLTVDQCVGIAVVRHPQLAAAQGAVKASESRIGQAVAAYLPQVNASGNYMKIKAPNGTSITSLESGSNKPYQQYSGSINASQLIYDFGKTPNQIWIQKYGAEASRGDFAETKVSLVLAVRQAYYGLLQAQRNRDVAKEVVVQFEQHLQQAQGFYEVGTKPKFDVIKAKADLSNAKLNLIKAENALRIAKVTLNNTLGYPDAPDYSIVDSLDIVKKEIPLPEAVERAYKNRPELLASDARVKASDEQVSYAYKGFLPSISAVGSYSRTGQDFLPPEGWTAGIALSWSLFNGFQTVHQVGEAKANLETAKANYDLLKQNVLLEVQQAYLQLMQAKESIPTAELGVQQATENLDIANGRYNAGVGSPIEVTDAQVTYINAKTAHTQALYDYQVAVASLEKAIGGMEQ